MTRRNPKRTDREPDETCQTRKKVYRTQIDATAELLAIAKRPELLGRSKQETRSYHCKPCGGYHLTSAPDIRRKI